MNSFKSRRHFVFILLILLAAELSGQSIKIDVSSTPLNQVLVDLRDKYDLQLSFNDRQLSSYNISLKSEFDTPAGAIRELIKDLPLVFEEREGIFIIYPKKRVRAVKSHNISGQVVDIETLEALPFSHILINGHGFATDFKGNFSYVSSSDSVFNITVSYLGYFVLDTMLTTGRGKIIPLLPSSIDIVEVVVKGSVIEHSVMSGKKAGESRINHKISGYLPGNGDNSVFNLLRLQPGILASGEQSSDLIIWGSYEGHSKVVFDGFTIFGLRNYNDNISAVNPYLAKDIKILKGGFGAEYGERVGGIIDISGIDGSTVDPHVNFNINNMTLNGMASIPLFEKSAVVLAFRQTYYDLNEAVSLNLFNATKGNRSTDVDVNIYPDYLFRDLNFKYSGRFDNGDNYFVSVYSGGDNFSYSTSEVYNNTTIYDEAEEENFQKGLSAFYGKKWKRGGVTNLTLAYSGLNTQLDESREAVRQRPGNRPDTVIFSRIRETSTSVSELDANIDNYFPVTKRHTIKLGAGIINNELRYKEDSSRVEVISNISDLQIFNAYATDIISLSENASIELGVRADYAGDLQKLYLQPRVSANIKLFEGFNVKAAWGKYNQFIALSSVVDESGNFRYQWTVCDNESIPVLSAEHLVGGISYTKGDFLVSLEAYKKKTDGLTRYIRTNFTRTILTGDSRSKGLDLFIKKQIAGHSAWVAYSLSKTEEYFPYTPLSDYMPALHDQRHELKVAAILNFEPVYLSTNYVYGSGFPVRTIFLREDLTEAPYSRLDASLVYKFARKKYLFDAGISVLNIFNTENIKYSNFIMIPDNQTSSINLHAEAVPRTFTIFLNLSF